MKKKRVIVWFRNDLRVHDNEALYDASYSAHEIYPIYVFDDRVFLGKTRFGFVKTGVHRAKFILESIKELKVKLAALNLKLIIRRGKTEDVIFELAKKLKTSWVFCNRERTQEEVDIQDALEKKLWSIGQEVRYSRGKMLYYTADLPFPVTHTPEVFTQFRKEVEKFVPIRQPLPVPEPFYEVLEDVHSEPIPTLNDFSFSDDDIKKAQNKLLMGGETAGLNRLKTYFWESGLVSQYKETRNGLLGMDYSSKFSAYLAQGCLSPKTIFSELKKYEERFGANKSTYHLFFELLWRDFFRLMGKKHGNRIFKKSGIRRIDQSHLTDNMELFKTWADGCTGIPFIDAAMIELNTTGFLSNRARQNVASFLVHDLQINWQIGAEYFESLLIDYDPCSNWGNWNYIAGVGNDPRENRKFHISFQASRYDANGDFVRYWIPALRRLPKEFVHEPSTLTSEEQKAFGFIIGKDYPEPIVNLTNES